VNDDAGRDDAVNCGPTPSAPPRGVREAMPISAMRARPLPVRSKDEIERLRRLFRRPESSRPARCAPPCRTISLPGISGGGSGELDATCRSRFSIPRGTGMQPAAGPCTGFPPGITLQDYQQGVTVWQESGASIRERRLIPNSP
jgi:hypothetical protein